MVSKDNRRTVRSPGSRNIQGERQVFLEFLYLLPGRLLLEFLRARLARKSLQGPTPTSLSRVRFKNSPNNVAGPGLEVPVTLPGSSRCQTSAYKTEDREAYRGCV
jgi:hypothetical protein